MNVLDLFSGIGGFSLGLERAGMRTVAFCEIDQFCRNILRKHWPHIRVFEDVRKLDADYLAATAASGDIQIDVICGGFPCQDISSAGNGAGIDGAKSGLWNEYARLVGEIRPRFVIVENSPRLLNRGIDRVLGDLAAIGYDAEWSILSACRMGAPHTRERLFIVAYPHMDGCQTSGPKRDGDDGAIFRRRINPGYLQEAALAVGGTGGEAFASEPDVGRVADGVPDRVDRGHALGNAVIPQIPEAIGRTIMRIGANNG